MVTWTTAPTSRILSFTDSRPQLSPQQHQMCFIYQVKLHSFCRYTRLCTEQPWIAMAVHSIWTAEIRYALQRRETIIWWFLVQHGTTECCLKIILQMQHVKAVTWLLQTFETWTILMWENQGCRKRCWVIGNGTQHVYWSPWWVLLWWPHDMQSWYLGVTGSHHTKLNV